MQYCYLQCSVLRAPYPVHRIGDQQWQTWTKTQTQKDSARDLLTRLGVLGSMEVAGMRTVRVPVTRSNAMSGRTPVSGDSTLTLAP